MPECRSRSDHNGRKWENFPAGLRVLVVDDDSLCLKVIEQMLRSCKYEVTTCMSSTKALEMLRERRSDFDLVLSDVFMPDIDGFKLLETIGLELQLPVIMMSSSGETNVVLRGVTHGAVDFLIKPVRVEELRNVWQHVVRRRKELGKDIEVAERPRLRDEVSNGDLSRKRKENSKDWKGEEGYATKKPRVNWSVEMHQQFVNAVNQLGIDKAVPKKILELMSVKGLTRENVASHLQKYRLYLKRMRGVQTTGIQPRLASASQPQQNASEMPSTGAVSQAVPPTPPGVFPAAVPGPPGVLGSVPQAIGSLVPALGPLGSNPNLANMQLQLQNMHLQGALSLGGSLDASTLVQLAGGFPPGLGVGMGSLQAHALMNMGLMAGVHGGNGPQFQGLQLGMSRSASVPVGGGVMDMSNRQLRRNNSAVAGSTELAKQGLSCERVRDPGPATLLSSVSEEAMPSMMPAIRGFDLGILSVGAYAGQQGKTESTSPTGNRAQLDLQVKKEDAGARPSTLQLSSCDNLEVGMLEPQGIAREVDAATATGFPVDEQLGVIGTAVNGDLGHFAAGDYVPFGDGSGVPVEETKDMGMDEFLNAFLRETSVSNDSAGQC